MIAHPLVIAHRGDSAHAVDNSLDAFEKAIGAGADAIELDVRRAREGKLIAFHDAEVAGARVARLTPAEIGERTGHVPPLLDHVLALAQGRVGVHVELKEDGYVADALAAIEARLRPGEVLVTSFLDGVVAQVKRLAPDLPAGLVTELWDRFAIRRARACGADELVLAWRLDRLGALDEASAAGLPVSVWTVNDDEHLRRYLADPRVRAVITDRPGRAVQLRAGAARERR
jgi:glycerophosphoryl diester phosphodiesterase